MATITQNKALQTSLNKKGANLKVDGIIGKLTNAAIAKFGAPVKPSTTVSTAGGGSSSSSSGSSTVAAQQRALNLRGANLVVDGISGTKTRAAALKFGGSYSSSSSSPISTASSARVGQTLSTRSSSNVSKPRSAVGNFFSSIGSSFKRIGKDDTKNIGGSVLDAPILEGAKLNPVGTKPVDTFAQRLRGGTLQKIAPVSPFSGQAYKGAKSMEFPIGAGMTKEQTDAANKSLGIESTESSSLTSTDSSAYALSAPAGSPESSPTTTTKNVATQPDGSITTTTTDAPAQRSALPTNVRTNANANSNLSNTLSTLDSSLTGIKSNPWDKYSKQGDVLSVANSAIQKSVSGYQSVEEFTQAYNTDANIKASVDKVMAQTGKTLADFTAQIQPVTNGLVSNQEVGNYLVNIKNTPEALRAQAEITNKQIVQESEHLNSTDKMAYDILAQSKLESQALIEQMERNEMRKDAQVREKSQWMMDKNRAEMEIADADIEQSRIAGKKNLTEFLAKIGALRTDGGAVLGLETLEQRYQAQRQSSRQKYMLANREIQMNMNSDLNDIENRMDENILKINMDLNKSEREVAMDSMKLRYEFQKDALTIQSKWQDKIQSERDKATARAEKDSKDYYSQYYTLSGWNEFQGQSKEYQNIWKQNAGSWIDDSYKGKITAPQVTRSAADYVPKELQMTYAQETKLSQNNVDIDLYKSDSAYRRKVDIAIGEL